MIDQRTRKLIVFIGDESQLHEMRDITKVDTELQAILRGANVQKSYAEVHTDITKKILDFLARAICQIPNKHHIYAVLTGFICQWEQPLAESLLPKVFDNIQRELNRCQVHTPINGFLYLSELMNLDIMNSFIFIGLLQDIVTEVQKCQSSLRVLYLRILARILPSCWTSLQQKMPQQLKKLIEKLKKQTEKLDKNSDLAKSWQLLHSLYQYGKLKDMSKAGNLRGQTLQKVPQFNPQFKLSFKDRSQLAQTTSCFFCLEQNDQLYRQFTTSLEGQIHRTNICLMVNAFWKSRKLLCDKIALYLSNSANSLLPRFLVETLFQEAMCSENTIIYSSILVQLANDIDETFKTDIRRAVEDTIYSIFNRLQNEQLLILERLSDICSFYFANIVITWQWQKFLEDEANFAKRYMFLSLTAEKAQMLSETALASDSYKDISKWIPKSKSSAHQRQLKQQLNYISKINEKLGEKADSDTVIPLVNGINEFEMFLECLMSRMGLSINHLNILSERYKKAISHLGRSHPKVILSSIYSYWLNSQYHRIQYITLFLEKQMFKMEAFVEWASVQAKVADTVDRLFLRRLVDKVMEKCGRNFENKEMLTELEESLNG